MSAKDVPTDPVEALGGMPHILHRIFFLGLENHGDFQRCRAVSKRWKALCDNMLEDKVINPRPIKTGEFPAESTVPQWESVIRDQ